MPDLDGAVILDKSHLFRAYLVELVRELVE